MKLNQIIALVSGKKARAMQLLTEAHHKWKDVLLGGIVRNYEPLNEDGERFPSESKEVQLRLHQAIPELKKYLSDYYDCVLTQESGNQSAKANIELADLVLKDIPVTTLLFLEKQITDLLTFTKNLPVLPTDKVWSFDTNKDCYITEPEKTTKTQKRPEVVVKYQATKEHPAQTEMFAADKTIGHWTTRHLSGAMPQTEKENIIKRLEILQDEIKSARESANNSEVEFKKMGEDILNYIFHTNK